MRHALGKARHAQLKPGGRNRSVGIVLGADTLISFRGRLIGKPATLREAIKILSALSGKSHRVYTAIALIRWDTGKVFMGYDKTKVTFKKWPEEKIKDYVTRVNPLDKAAGYAIQKRPFIVAARRGSLSNVIGLPTQLLRRLLRSALGPS